MPNTRGARLWVRTSNSGHAIDSAAKVIQAHPFNRKLQLILPASQQQAQQAFDVSAFYYAIRTHLATLTELACAQSSFSEGLLSAVCLDRSQAACVTPDQHLHVLMSKDQHQRLGITGARVGPTGKTALTPRRKRQCQVFRMKF